MSTETLSGLRDYLFSTLSRSNMLWLATQLKERAEKEEELKPYTIEELHQMVEEGRKADCRRTLLYQRRSVQRTL